MQPLSVAMHVAKLLLYACTFCRQGVAAASVPFAVQWFGYCSPAVTHKVNNDNDDSDLALCCQVC